MRLIILFSLYITFDTCIGQINPIDSCGVDSKWELNQYEVSIIDSVLFPPYVTKKHGVKDRKNGFDFKDRKIAFFSCAKEANTKGKGMMSKKEFFDLFKPVFTGHAGIGFVQFDENEKKQSHGFDAVIVIDCPYDAPDTSELLSKLAGLHQ